MMNSVFVNAALPDDQRRAQLYSGQVFVYGAKASSLAFTEFAKELIADAFGDTDPETAQHEMPVEDFASLLATLKPTFIHHPRSKRLRPEMLHEFGCDLEQTYFDVPRLRTSTSDDYLSSGISYAFHPHRDCWYSAPFCQINWWMPIYPVVAENVMAFHPRYFDQPVANGSAGYDYEEWKRTSRRTAASHVGTDTRPQPKPEEPIELDPQIRLVAEPGGAMLFSGAQLHSTVPNTSGRTRFSIDFRTVHLADVAERRGAPNVDARCTGTTLGDFVRATDCAPMPEELAARYADQVSYA
jgi:hypothetical protein